MARPVSGAKPVARPGWRHGAFAGWGRVARAKMDALLEEAEAPLQECSEGVPAVLVSG